VLELVAGDGGKGVAAGADPPVFRSAVVGLRMGVGGVWGLCFGGLL